MNIFDKITEFVNNTEDSIVNLVSVIVPWGVPLIPAYITYQHVINQLRFPVWAAWTAGGVVEGLGLATMNTFFRFWNHNRHYKDEKNQFSIWIPVGAYVWYLSIVLLVNVVFDLVSGVQWYNVLAIGLFSTLSLPAGALISVRTLYTEWKSEHSRALSTRSTQSKPERGQSTPEQIEQKGRSVAYNPEQTERASDYAEQIQSMLEREYQRTGIVPRVADISRAFNLDPRASSGYISTLRKSWMTVNNIVQEPVSNNGNGRH